MALLMLSILSATAQATPERKWLSSERQPRQVYTDRLTFYQLRVNKLLEIIGRARSAQRKIRNSPLYQSDWDQQQALKPWQRVESQARRMLVDTQERAKTLTLLSSHRSPLPAGAYPAQESRAVPHNVLLTRLDGKQERMTAHRGDVVLLHFWATWCRPCINEIPSLQRLYQQFRSQNFTVLAVSLDARKGELRKFFHRRPLRFPVYFDPGRVVYQKMIGGLEVLPRSLLIDQKGRIVQSYTGAQHLAAPATFTAIQNLLDTN